MKTFTTTTLSLAMLVCSQLSAMDLRKSAPEKAEPQKVDLLWAFSKLSTLQKLDPLNLVIDGMPEYMQTHESTALLQEGLLAAHKAVTITQEGSAEPKVTIETQHFMPLLAAISQLNKERQIWSLATTLYSLDVRSPNPFLMHDIEVKLRNIDPDWRAIADKLQARRTEWENKVAHRASQQPTMQELEAKNGKNEPEFLGSIF